MAIAYPRNRVRLSVDAKKGEIKDVILGSTPQFWSKSATDVEFAIFWDEDLIDISAFSSISIYIMAKTRHGPASSYKTIALASMDNTLTLSDWNGGLNEHGVATFAASDLDIDLGGAKEDTFWLKVVGTRLTGGDPVALGGVDMLIKESGIDLVSNNPAQGANLVPGGAVYSGGGTYTLAVTVNKVHSWLKGANDTNVVNGTETLTTSGNFTAQGSSVTLTGTAGQAVTAIVRYPLYPTWDEIAALTDDVLHVSNDSGIVFQQRSPNGRFIRVLGVDDFGNRTDAMIDTQNVEPT